MTMKEKKYLQEKVENEGEFQSESGNEVYWNKFYKYRGCLINIQTRYGKLFDVINYGRR